MLLYILVLAQPMGYGDQFGLVISQSDFQSIGPQ